jgi:CRISPR-associated endonuclease Csn1
MKYRLALDMGSTSLGWCVLALDQKDNPSSIINMGVRIFSDGRENAAAGKVGEPLAVARRNARGARRNNDRRDRRQKRLMAYLIQHGLMPENYNDRKKIQSFDPYALRSAALDKEIPLHHLGRALFHINQRRGFQSNLRADKKENDVGNMKGAIKDMEGRLCEWDNEQKRFKMGGKNRTLGEYFWKECLKETSSMKTLTEETQSNKKNIPERTPTRVRTWKGQKDKNEYSFYPSRQMYKDEVAAILEKQKTFHPTSLTAEVCDTIQDIIFHQRRLKPVKVGPCRFAEGKERARLALPLVQKFRILQEVNNLQIDHFYGDEPEITIEHKKTLSQALLNAKWKKTKKAMMTFGQLGKLINLPSGCRFNLESERREGLSGDETSALLSDETCFGERWYSFTNEQQETIVKILFDQHDPDLLVEQLTVEWDVSPQQAENIANAPLPEGYGSVSTEAITKMMPFLEQGMKYSEAAKAAGYHHSDFSTGQVFDHLPYYGEILPNNVIGGSKAEADRPPEQFRNKTENSQYGAKAEKYFGKINNPTVHIALNQARKLVNALIDTYGPPEQVVIELARQLKEPADEITKDQTKNQEDNKRINKELEKLGIKENYANRMKFKLWEDLCKDDLLKRLCPFCSNPHPIALHQLFTSEIEIEHLLPFSRSYNDGRANKVVAHIGCNRKKGNRTPYEAFGHTSDWPEMLTRIQQNLPKNKQWRFKEECWEIAAGKVKVEGVDTADERILARMLNDTRYMTKIAKAYLSAVFDNEKGKSKIWAVPGQMTALLRDKWGLNDMLGEEDGQKDRTDHRHHAIDAFVIGCSDRGTFNKLSAAARKLEEDEKLYDKRYKLVTEMPEPFAGFREQMSEKLENMVVSYKPDHGNAASAINAARPYTIAGLHKETAYGFIRKGEKKGTIIVATRSSVDSFAKLKQLEEIADPVIRATLTKHLEGIKEGSAEWKAALLKFAEKTGTRRVRVHIEKTQNVLVPIAQPKDRGPEETRGQDYKFYAMGGNYCAEIYCPDKGKDAGKWQCEIITNYYVHKKDFITQWRNCNPTAKLIMRLHANDIVAYEEDGNTQIKRVRKLDKSTERVYLQDQYVAVDGKLIWAASANQLKLKNARKISVDILGRVKDPARMKKKSESA